LEDQNKAVARAAFFDCLNHRDFKRFEEIHTKDFVKHYNNSPAENLSEERKTDGLTLAYSDTRIAVHNLKP
jgi:hypothetical protein